MLKKFIEGVKDILPAIGGTLGYAIAGPAGAAIGSGLGSLVRGDPGQEAFQNALLAGSIGAGGQRFLSGGSGPIGQFFAKGNIPGVVGGDTGILKAFSQRNFSPTMEGFGFGGKYLPGQAGAESLTIGGGPDDPRLTGLGSTGNTISGDTLKEFNRLKGLGTGTPEGELLKMARENVLSGEAGGDTGILSQVLGFGKENPELVLGAGVLLDQMGFFDESDKDELPQSPAAGSQGSLPTGLAQLIAPVVGADGTYSYGLAADGGIMTAKQGKQASGLTERQEELLRMLDEQRRQEILEQMENERMKFEQFQNPKFTPDRKLTIGAAEGMMMDRKFNPDGGVAEMMNGNIASFKENSPRRDLFLEREGPISDDRGSPNKDTVFAKLADGEFVVNADTVADIGYGMGAKGLDQAKEMGGSFFYGLQDAQKKGILGNMVGTA
jgi:hypothetical protein|tara:strand:+ start:41 stop:1354 length:1314 start_codon:yes stop_codon:yes gene_type:complete